MKKLFLSLTFAITAFVANAQFTIIPKIGLAVASTTNKPKENDARMTNGVQLGVACDMRITDIFSVQPELLFIQKGQKFKKALIGAETTTLTINYLEIPVLAKLKFGNDNAKFYVNVGPSLGIAMSASYKQTGESAEDIPIGSSDDDFFKRTDIGAQFGAGLMLGNFMIDLRYGLGLTNIINGGDNDLSQKNNVIGITVGYAIPL